MAHSKGQIRAISVSVVRGTKKKNVSSALAVENLGIQGDAHADNWHRQISLLAEESIDKMIARGADVKWGDFAENITTTGIDLSKLRVGSQLRLGTNVEIEITQIGKECHSRCEIFEQVGDCIMPREGIFARILKGGVIEVGHAIETIND